jgi:hypothetical protein
MKRILIFGIVAFILAMYGTGQAGVFVDWKGKYYVTYPDSWYQVPYNDVNLFLDAQGVKKSEFDYDAVLAEKSDEPFYDGPYIFLTYRPEENMTEEKVDSLIRQTWNEYGYRQLNESFTQEDFVFPDSIPVFEESLNAVAVKVRIQKPQTDKTLLEIRKYYEYGVLMLLCYAPTNNFPSARPVFLDVLKSFSTRNLHEAAEKEKIHIVEPETSRGDDLISSNTVLIIAIPALVILAICIFMIRKKT